MAGADPSFTETHILRTVFILDSGVTGRKKLVKQLGVGEGSVRTIIKRLSKEGLVSSSKKGHSLTDKGLEAVSKRLTSMSKPIAFDLTGLVPSGYQSLVVVYRMGDTLSGTVGLRDTALRAGADGAVILVYEGEYGLRFPDSGMDLSEYPLAAEKLLGLDLADGDVVVIGFASSREKAEDGAVAVALQMLGE
jgi:predicted transcriptional regulator